MRCSCVLSVRGSSERGSAAVGLQAGYAAAHSRPTHAAHAPCVREQVGALLCSCSLPACRYMAELLIGLTQMTAGSLQVRQGSALSYLLRCNGLLLAAPLLHPLHVRS